VAHLVEAGIVELVEGGPMGRLDAEDIAVIVEPRQCLARHVPQGLPGLLLAEEARPALHTVDPVNVEARAPLQRPQLDLLLVLVLATRLGPLRVLRHPRQPRSISPAAP
jgi:hypothetical protein